jgi:hypothetical protein
MHPKAAEDLDMRPVALVGGLVKQVKQSEPWRSWAQLTWPRPIWRNCTAGFKARSREIAAFHMLISIKRTCFLENYAQISWTCNLQLAATTRLHHQSHISPTCVRRRVSGSESMVSEDCWFAWDRVIDWTQDFCVSFFSTWFWGPQAAAAD